MERMVADSYTEILGITRASRKALGALEISEAMADAPVGIYVVLGRMVERGWLDKEGSSYRITALGRTAHDYAKAERDGS